MTRGGGTPGVGAGAGGGRTEPGDPGRDADASRRASGAAADRPALSVAMMARNAQDTVGRALDSVAWADERVVLDSGSCDGTPELARTRGARVVETDWPGYAAQRRRALEEVSGPWVLSLDADEVVTPELAEEIRGLLAADPDAAGYEIPFLTRYLGRLLGRWGWHRERHLRLVRKDAVRVTEARVHEGLTVDGPVGRLRHPVLHYSFRDVGHHWEKIREYAELKARDKLEAGEGTTLAGAVGHGAAAFLSEYLLRGRLLEGWPGLVFSAMAGQAALLAYLRLWEMRREEGR